LPHRQIRSLQGCSVGGSGVSCGVAAVRHFCLLFFGSGTWMVVSGGVGKRFGFPCFGGRVGIPDGSRSCAADAVGGGGCLFRSPTVWPAVVDILSSPTSHKSTADALSSLMMRFGDATEHWLMRLNQSLTLLVRCGGGARMVMGWFLLGDGVLSGGGERWNCVCLVRPLWHCVVIFTILRAYANEFPAPSQKK
jgi:hypothetical protein